ncbi:unnamed protein product [Zymoseptoria tritici ST99CH_3D7]|uniref:Hyaluronan/mRNA-binding protein domain-containing protein n=1 Tax=Zymoseptoria tritici (strain ST99CH_3D7) TaxID=1276538 RepID=A0A1X7REY5_ZYMT9|nr:unnamed protein product [Zymoseptoria tritici ST99CH_3D7]
MSSAIASKNLYDLLGNDPDQDPDRAPDPPVKVVDKPAPRVGKRNVATSDPLADPLRPNAGRTGGGRGDQAGSNNREQRDDRNRNREARGDRGEGRGEGRGRGGRGRGGRGGRGGAPRDDRHSHTGIQEHEKQAAHGWGAETGTAEWADERAGEAIASAEAKNDAGFTPDTTGADPAFSTGPGGPGEVVGEDAVAEPEDNTKSYTQYLAEQAEKRAALSSNLSVRQANEGSKQQFPEGKAFSRETEDFIAGSGGKARKAKEAQDKKERLTLEGEIVALEADAAVATLEEVPAAVSALSNAVVPAVVSMLPMRLPSQHSEEHKRPYHSTTHGFWQSSANWAHESTCLSTDNRSKMGPFNLSISLTSSRYHDDW